MFCFSSFQCAAASNPEGGARPGGCVVSGSRLGNTDLVSSAPASAGATAGIAAKEGGAYLPATQPRPSPPTLEENATSSLSLLRQSLQQKGVSSRTQEILMCSWRSRTKKQYRTYISKWIAFCNKRNINHIQPNLSEVLDYLTFLYDSGLQFSAINTARSALSSFVTLDGEISLGKHPLITRFSRAVFQTRPALPRYQHTWNVNKVISYLEQLFPLDTISLKQLTLKMVMLIALVTGQRCQSIHMLDLRQLTVLQDSVQFVIDVLVKQSRPGQEQQVLVFHRYSHNRSLCVVETLREYLIRTRYIRDDFDSTQLFISYMKPHRLVSRDTVSRWVKTVMAHAGVDVKVFKPHSTRAASTSKVCSSGAPLTSIMKAAGWSNTCTFRKFYRKPLDNSAGYAESLFVDKRQEEGE